MLKRLRNKLLLLNMVALAVVVVASFSVIFFILYQYMHSTDENRLASIPTDVITNAMLSETSDASGASGADAGDGDDEEGAKDGMKPFVDVTGPNLPIDYSNFFVVNLNENGTLSIFSRMDMNESDYITAVEEVAKAGGDKTGDIRINGSHWLYSYSETAPLVKRPGAALFGDVLYGGESMVFLNVDDTDRALKHLLISLIIIGACVLAGLFLISLAFSNRAMRPTEESIVRQRQFVADASHELKTPLAIIDANAEAALDERIAPGARLWIERIEEESGRMRGLIDDLLFLARSEDAADIAFERIPVDLSAAAEREIHRLEAVLFEKGIGLEFKSPVSGGVIVSTDPERVRQIFLILLDNAMKYTDEGGSVIVETGRDRKCGYVEVSNTGDGIADDDLPHIFDRFYRADKARTSAAARGGYGLGLSIAKAIAQRAGGNITARSEDGGGLTVFRVELPLG